MTANTPTPELELVERDVLWCESCGEAEQAVCTDYAGLCAKCWKEQGEPK